MDASLLAAHEELKIGRQDIQKACASIPFAACMRQVHNIPSHPPILLNVMPLASVLSDCMPSCLHVQIEGA